MARRSLATACLLAFLASLGLSACNPEEKQGVGESRREGLALTAGDIEYNVFITRQLNTRIPPDKAYYKGPDPGPSANLYGVFLQACNTGEKPKSTTDHFTIVDNQGNKFEPMELPKDNAFAYHATRLQPDQCVPEVGSVAQLGPTAGSMLLFKLPLANTENRPLDLEIESPYDPATAKRETLKVELDL